MTLGATIILLLWILFDILRVETYYLSLLPKSVPKTPKCCYFTGAGIYFFWQLGCAQYIKENCDIDKLPIVVGASAGSLTATFLLSNTDFKLATEKALELAETNKVYERKSGLAGIWGTLLKEWLDSVIPENVNALNFENLYISVTPPLKPSKLVTGFDTKSEVIEACLASCHVPLFLNGRPFADYKGESVVDGSFWYFITKNRETGLPLPVGLTVDDVFWIDYGDDEQFMNTISGNFLSLITPTEMTEMVEAGYNYMKREHFQGRLPMANAKYPNFVNTFEVVKEQWRKFPSIQLLRLKNIRDYAGSSIKWLTSATGAGVTGVGITTATISSSSGGDIIKSIYTQLGEDYINIMQTLGPS